MRLKSYEYYRNENGVIYCGDCLEIMPLLEPVDLCLTDPPYGVRKDEKWDILDYFLLNFKEWL
ncbi:MAG TPA: hypothetical protein ENL09_02460, partial [Bacteroidetes bacterium]|nr:hypothetical protein [Bacteroidota bacterium]